MPGQIEHEYRGWKIKITNKTVDTDVVVPFLKLAASRAEAQAAAFRAAKKWIDRKVDCPELIQ